MSTIYAHAQTLKNLGITVEEAARSMETFRDVMSKIEPLPTMRTIAGNRMVMMFDHSGPLCLFSLEFWRWAFYWVRDR